MKKCKTCGVKKDFSFFHTCGTYKNKTYYRGECIQCNNLFQKEKGVVYVKKYRSTEKYRKKKKEWQQLERNKEKAKEYAQRPEVKKRNVELAKKRSKARYKKDPFYRLKITARSRLYEVLTRCKYPKRGSIFKYLGCDIDVLKTHLEQQFKNGMSWDNYGEWHVDHIIPLASAKNEEEIIKLFHYSNLQPLWGMENKIKGSKMPK
jgi:hypothetical protein